ncbi:MAG TPA: alpha-hydroxy acid oxidase [Acidobacteriota bacterium]|nr:alpha-hydroxy acid oxidase [Acidobacteriota bacterium]
MTHPAEHRTTRRGFLRYLAGSPVLAGVGMYRWPIGGSSAGRSDDEIVAEMAQFVSEQGRVVYSPDQAVSIFDFEATARTNVPPSHFAYMATGVDGEATLRANREAIARVQLRARHLVDVSEIDMSTEIFGRRWETPIVIQPCGSQKAFHPEGEVAVARAARARGHLQTLSTVTTSSVEEVNEARGEPVWYQLYPTDQWAVTDAILRRVEAAGCPVVMLTVDHPVGGNRETSVRGSRDDPRDCSLCHVPPAEGVSGHVRRKPMFDGLDLEDVSSLNNSSATWEFVDRIKDTVGMRLVVKGVVTREDAELCVEHGVDGIVVSNHGGRNEPTARGTIESLPEVVDAVAGRVPVIVDGGFRRGADMLRALALGADAVGIGRPYLWGLGAFGEAGVDAVLHMLSAELSRSMALVGAPSLKVLNRSFVAGI